MRPRIALSMTCLTPIKPVSTSRFNCLSLRRTYPLSGVIIPHRTSLRPSQYTSRSFTTTPHSHNWLAPKRGHTQKNRKGKPRVPTGGSTRGTTVIWGDWGIRMRDHDRRISAAQLNLGAETIKRRLRGQRYRLYTRVCANIGVYTSGNEMRMGKGKGSFDHWASRVAVSKVLFELKGELHEEIVRDAFRLAANKMPGEFLWNFFGVDAL